MCTRIAGSKLTTEKVSKSLREKNINGSFDPSTDQRINHKGEVPGDKGVSRSYSDVGTWRAKHANESKSCPSTPKRSPSSVSEHAKHHPGLLSPRKEWKHYKKSSSRVGRR